MQNRGLSYLESIIKYCQDIEDIHTVYDNSYEKYYTNKGYQYSVSFCVEQIGELGKKLRDIGYAEKYPDVSWNEIAGLRNRIAHGYDAIDLEMVYDISINDIPKLLQSCKDILHKETSLENHIQNSKQRAVTVQIDSPAKENER